MSKELHTTINEYLPLRDVVFQTLRQSILHGELKPGERLMEIHLAERLGVSRTPIREAIRKLELEGLVEMIPRRGAVVASITEKDLKDVLEVRRTLEILAGEVACERITPELLEELKRAEEEFSNLKETEDVNHLERQGLLKKIHGGAKLAEGGHTEDIQFRETTHYPEKLAIVREALRLIPSIQKQFESLHSLPLRPPKTWKEFNGIAQFFTKEFNSYSPTLYGTSVIGKIHEELTLELLIRMWSFGGGFYDNTGKIKLNTPQNIKAFQSLLESCRFSEHPFYETSIDDSFHSFGGGGDWRGVASAASYASLYDSGGEAWDRCFYPVCV